jgi:hypothetical protein
MTPSSSTQKPQFPWNSGTDVSPLAVVAMVSCIVAVLCIGAMGAASLTAMSVLVVYVIFAALLARRAIKGGKAIRFRKIVLGLLGLSVLAGLLSGPVVFFWRWLPFSVEEWIVTILYIAALGFGLLRALAKLWRVLAAFLALAMVTATIALPVPKGGEGNEHDDDWSVNVAVTDQNDQPLADAVVQCVVWIDWLGSPSLEAISPKITGSSGQAEPWTFTEDRRLKSVLCGAQKLSNRGNAGYPMQTKALLAPHQGENELEITLSENQHSDTAYLVVSLDTAPSYAWYYLQFELWDGLPPAGFGSGGNSLIASESWQNIGNQGFTITPEHAGKELYLRYRYERPGGDSSALVPPAISVETMSVGKVELGKRKVKRVALPPEPASR